MQKDRWEKEYRELKNLPSSRTDKPSRALIDLIESGRLTGGGLRAWDVGSGVGRNAFYLADNGFEVDGTEISEVALEVARSKAAEIGLTDKVRFHQKNAGEVQDFPDQRFDLIVDMMVLHLLDPKEREVYSKEVVRLLKPGGVFLFYTIAADSPAAQELFETSPGPEPNSYIIPQSGMFEKGFTEEELLSLFAPLKMEEIDRQTQFTPAFGDVYERVYYKGLMVKE